MYSNDPAPHRALADIDLGELAFLLSSEEGGYYDLDTGETFPIADGSIITGDDEIDLDELDLVRLDTQSREGYDDMTDFADAITDPTLSDRLIRSLDGRGVFRRFRNTLAEEGEALREIWFRFSDARQETRAIEWLVDNEVCSESEAADALQDRAAVAERALHEAAAWTRTAR